MARKRFQTDSRLWLVVSGGLFVAFGFVDPLAGVAKGDNNLWAYVARFFTHDYIGSDFGTVILFRSALQAIPAVALGWVAQAVVVVARCRVKAAPGTTPDQSLEQNGAR